MNQLVAIILLLIALVINVIVISHTIMRIKNLPVIDTFLIHIYMYH